MIIERLAEIRESLDLPDRRFLYSWRLYLRRRGDTAAIGRWRLAMLRKVAGFYGIEVEPVAQIKEGNYEILSDLILS